MKTSTATYSPNEGAAHGSAADVGSGQEEHKAAERCCAEHAAEAWRNRLMRRIS